jgi:ABC-type transporter Mla subunit MlaD
MTKRIWRHKWWVLVATMVIFLSVGAVAWAAADDGTAESTPASAAEDGPLPGLCAAVGDPAGLAADAGECAQNMRERGERWLKRQQMLMDKLREQMDAADQALYDRLVAAAKEQREALKEARKNLAETMKQLRDLRDKYLDEALGDTAR